MATRAPLVSPLGYGIPYGDVKAYPLSPGMRRKPPSGFRLSLGCNEAPALPIHKDLVQRA